MSNKKASSKDILRGRNHLKKICKLEGWVFTFNNSSREFYIYEKGDILFKLNIKSLPDLFIINIQSPLIFNIHQSEEVFIKNLLAEKEIRVHFKEIEFLRNKSDVYILRRFSLSKRLSAVNLLSEIKKTLYLCENICRTMQNKLDIIYMAKNN